MIQSESCECGAPATVRVRVQNEDGVEVDEGGRGLACADAECLGRRHAVHHATHRRDLIAANLGPKDRRVAVAVVPI